MWRDLFGLKGKEAYLSVVHNYVDVHGTVFINASSTSSAVPSYVVNHRLLPAQQLHQLMAESKVPLLTHADYNY